MAQDESRRWFVFWENHSGYHRSGKPMARQEADSSVQLLKRAGSSNILVCESETSPDHPNPRGGIPTSPLDSHGVNSMANQMARVRQAFDAGDL